MLHDYLYPGLNEPNSDVPGRYILCRRSTFIVRMGSDLSPNPHDTTNALLKILINKLDNGTFSEQDASLPVWTGPSSTDIWIQTLAYTGLSISLLASSGAMVVKQWLECFKTSRFGRGSLDERSRRRQQKLDGLETWHMNAIIAILSIGPGPKVRCEAGGTNIN